MLIFSDSDIRYIGLGMFYAIGRQLIIKVLQKITIANRLLDGELTKELAVVGGEIKVNSSELLTTLKAFEAGARISIVLFVAIHQPRSISVECLKAMRSLLNGINESVEPFINVSQASNPQNENIKKWRKKCKILQNSSNVLSHNLQIFYFIMF